MGAIAACASLAVAVSGAAPPTSGAASGPCPMGGTCTVKSARGLYLTWTPGRAVPSPVFLAERSSMPGAFWILGYSGYEIKVGTTGLTLCLGLEPGPRRRGRYGVELARCSGRRDQQWTMTGTRTFGSHVTFVSVAHDAMCLTALADRKRSSEQRSASGRSARGSVVVERCAPGTRGKPDQIWST